MIEKFLRYAKDLESPSKLVAMYQDLAEIFKEAALYQRQAACLEKIWNITKKHELLLEVGDIFLQKLKSPNIAFVAYNRYFQFTQPEFYKKYMTTLVDLGYHNFDSSLDDKDYSRKLIRLCDNFDTIFYMILYLHKIEEYNAIMQLESYLIKYKNKIHRFIKKHPEEELEMLLEIENNAKQLSEVLAQTKHRNDINQLAITLNPQNKNAYINIIEDLIFYKNYDEAKDFYNKEYCKAFSLANKYSLVQICWEISDYNRDKYDFAQAVLFQKIALEMELVECN